MDLGTDVITEVEIQPQMEEVEIETELGEDDGSGGIEISVGDDLGLDDEEVILQHQEEIVGYDDTDMSLVGDSGILMDHVEEHHHHHHQAGPSSALSSSSSHHSNHHSHHHHHLSLPTKRFMTGGSGGSSSSRKTFHNNRKRGKGGESVTLTAAASPPQSLSKSKKWEPKQVQIRTLEGAFSVTMWASGNDDGKIHSITLFLLYVYHLPVPRSIKRMEKVRNRFVHRR